jgi:hypothetical protein
MRHRPELTNRWSLASNAIQAEEGREELIDELQ